MSNDNVTPTTKRLGIICLTLLGLGSIAGVSFGTLVWQEALIVIVPVITAVAALLDGGR